MKELGEFLKTERLRQGIQLATITEQTCISRSMLIALEEGDTSKIGTPLLVRSFTRAYCRILRMDPTAVLEKYTGEIPRHERLDDGIKRFREQSLAARERTRLRLIMAAVALVAVVAVYATAVWLPKRDTVTTGLESGSTNRDQGIADVIPPDDVLPPRVPEDRTRPDASLAGGASPANPTAAGNGGAQPDATYGKPDKPGEPAIVPESGYRLRIEALQESWVEVRLDDKKVQGVLIPTGQSREWNVSQGLRLLLGNGAGVKVFWNGKRLKHLGKAGQAVRLRLPEDASKY
jgi:cytoskeleton protein RodZ